MNFLGHCYLCQDHMHLITGNLGGDFYKGNLDNFNHLPKHIQQGVKFHRFIDDFTDKSKQIIEVGHLLQKNGIAKVSFIACDILLDHYLARNWNQYSTIPYSNFIQEIYAEVNRNIAHTEPDFRFLFNKLQEHGWFYDYPSIQGIGQVLHQYSHRLKFDNELARSSAVYSTHQKTVDSYFETFLNEIQIRSKEFILAEHLNIS
jgi:acyl carrier protein phosphodiesterase